MHSHDFLNKKNSIPQDQHDNSKEIEPYMACMQTNYTTRQLGILASTLYTQLNPSNFDIHYKLHKILMP